MEKSTDSHLANHVQFQWSSIRITGGVRLGIQPKWHPSSSKAPLGSLHMVHHMAYMSSYKLNFQHSFCTCLNTVKQLMETLYLQKANWPTRVEYAAFLLCACDSAQHSGSDNHRLDKNTWHQEFLSISTTNTWQSAFRIIPFLKSNIITFLITEKT